MKNSEVWLVDFSPKIGKEIDKVRPAIIVNHDSIGVLPLKIVVPLTHARTSVQHWHVLLTETSANGLSKNSIADCFQVKSVSERRFVKKIGKLSELEMNEVKLGLVKVLGLV
ncbi:MAG: type II toxin-antitoxin system PemK/MazF family toxin [Cyclobacteriaceae bacterium]|nr:type II toxin-antitoxin system PemK/MazF family toxin [Cyclobacteriaceae bacterium]